MEALAWWVWLGVVVVVLSVGSLVVFIWRRLQRYRSTLREMGFAPCQPPDEALAAAMQRLQPGVRLHNVYKMDRVAYQVYLCDMEEPGDSSETGSSGQSVALLSPDFNLPHFVIFPNLQVPFLGRLVELALQKMTARYNLQRITFPESRIFDDAYLLLGEGPDALRDFFTLERQNRLAGAAKNYQINGLGNLLVFSRLDLQVRAKNDRERVASLLEGVAVLYAIFRD